MYGKPAIHVISNAGRAGGIELLGPTIELTRENRLSGFSIHLFVVDTERLSC
jgi:hypothetical protein